MPSRLACALVLSTFVACGCSSGNETNPPTADAGPADAAVDSPVDPDDGGDADASDASDAADAADALDASDASDADDGGPTVVCGDGKAEAGEACDGADLAGQGCAALGFVGGKLTCTPQCTLDTAQCTHCGDGALDSGEACDGAQLDGNTCVSLGFDQGALACTGACAFDKSACSFATCGDGALNGGEQCDGAKLGQASCASLGFDGGALACAGNCIYDTTPCFKCGDAKKNGAEACDGLDLGAASCASLGFDGGALACAGSCSFDTTACFKCGDGKKNGAEACDGADPTTTTCADLGFVTGTLTCGPACAWNTSQCVSACDLDTAPTITLPPNLVVPSFQPFTLGATVVDDGPLGALTITWTGTAGAPALVGADTLAPSGTAADCGAFEYTVTATDPCGHSASATVHVTVPSDGPYVSSASCSTAYQCGTVLHPWCTIQLGVDYTSSPQVKVAGAPIAYLESVVMRDGVDVLGGYEPTFTAPRNLDPLTNQTAVQSTTSAFTWPAQATAAVDGFLLIPAMPPVSASQRAVLAMPGDADATVANVVIKASIASPKYSTEHGIKIGPGQGGSLVVQSSVIQAAKSGSKTVALGTDPLANVAITVTQSSLLSEASNGSSLGVEQAGTGPIIITGGTIKAGLCKTTYGVYASTTASPAARQIELHDVAVEGNRGETAYGIRVNGGASLLVQGGSVFGKGASTGVTTAYGITADSVGLVQLDGVTVLATDAGVVNATQTQLAHGVQLSNSLNVPSASASLVNVTLEGGTLGMFRRGLLSNGVPLDIQGSTIAGSRTPVVYGSNGATSLAGVELTGTFPVGTVIHIHANPEIIGGDAKAPCFGPPCGGAAVLFNAPVDSLLEQNQLIQGTFAGSGYSTDGIRITQGGTHVIQQNDTLAGGPHIDGGSVVFAGVNVVSLGATVAQVTVANNTLIIGNPSNTVGSSVAAGFHGEGVDATIKDNTRIVGGLGANPAGISIFRSLQALNGPYSSTMNTLNITGNTIEGGTYSAAGGIFDWQTGTVTGNVFRACGLQLPNGQPDDRCLQVGTSYGLRVQGDNGTLFANNYIFGGYTSQTTACRLGCANNTCVHKLDVTFVDNLCAASSHAYPATVIKATALELGTPTAADCPRVAGNILDASGAAGTVYAFLHLDPFGTTAPNECYQVFNNDLVPRNLPCASYVYVYPKVWCSADAADLNTHGNALQQIGGNVSVTPGYVAEDLLMPTAAGYHLDATCALGHLGTPEIQVTDDYDHAARDPAQPTIGPDECP